MAVINSKIYAWLLTLAGSVGLIASFVITLEKLRLTQNPNYVPSCSLDPVISCGSIMQTAQASLFGFPNSWLGLAGFTAVIVVGVGLLAGATFRAWFWRLFSLGTLLGALLAHWLFFQSVFVIGALCPWCMLVWAVTIPIFWYTTLQVFRSQLQALQNYKHLILALWFCAIAGAVLYQFWYYVKTLV